MTALSQGDALLALALLGALVQFALALRLYEPPPPEDGDEPPTPLLEATLFGVAFGLGYAVVGFALSALGDVGPPYGDLGVFLVAVVGLYSAYATHVGRVGAAETRATRAMGLVTGITIAAAALVVLLL